MKKAFTFFILAAAMLIPSSLSAESIITVSDPATALKAFTQKGATYVITCTVDGAHSSLSIPDGSTLRFSGGKLNNVTLKGSAIRLEGDMKGVFSHAHFSGDFTVPEISTDMFASQDFDNMLRDVFALSSDKIRNTVIINPRTDGKEYTVDLSESPNGIDVRSNTDIILRGVVRLKGSDRGSYSIFNIHSVKNVTLSGGGTIIGDRATHTGTGGEWGMGITIQGSDSVHITGINVRDCWGDCIYICNGYTSTGAKVASTNIEVDSCELTGSRRQGVSVVNGKYISLHDLLIKDIYGTDPQSAVDLEPNHGDTVAYVTMKRLTVRHCKEGLVSMKPDNDVSRIMSVHISDCDIESEEIALSANAVDTFEVRNTRALTEYTGVRSHQSYVNLDSCYIGTYDGKNLKSGIIVLWDVVLNVTNSEFHAAKLIDNPKVTPASKNMRLINNKFYCPVELKATSGLIKGNIITTDSLPILSVILGENNRIRDNKLIYTGKGQAKNALSLTGGNIPINNSIILGLSDVKTDDDVRVNVYTTDGVLLRKNAKYSQVREMLPKGCYIAGKKKIAVR